MANGDTSIRCGYNFVEHDILNRDLTDQREQRRAERFFSFKNGMRSKNTDHRFYENSGVGYQI